MAAKESNDFSDDSIGGSDDAQLQLKKRARRRLVGAIALALLAIIVLPVVMDREPAPAAPEIQVRIPSPVSGGLVGKPTKPIAVQKSPAAVAEPVAEPMPAATVSALAPDRTVGAEPKRDAAPDVRPEVRPETKAETKAEIKPDTKSVTKTETKPEPVKDASPTGKWEVQLGAYQNAGNVALLMSKLKEMRVPAYTEKFDSPNGPRTRVRAGPFATKEAALVAQKRARIIGVDGPVAPSSK